MKKRNDKIEALKFQVHLSQNLPIARNENIDGASDWCVCLISHGIMIDPVAYADGHCYDRVNIELWLTKHNTSP